MKLRLWFSVIALSHVYSFLARKLNPWSTLGHYKLIKKNRDSWATNRQQFHLWSYISVRRMMKAEPHVRDMQG